MNRQPRGSLLIGLGCLFALACSSGGGGGSQGGSGGTAGDSGHGGSSGGSSAQSSGNAGSSAGGSSSAGQSSSKAGGGSGGDSSSASGGHSTGGTGTGTSTGGGGTGKGGTTSNTTGGATGSGGATGTTGGGGASGTGTGGNSGAGNTGTTGGAIGGTTGSATGGATGGGGASGAVTPTVSSTKYRFAYGDVVMEIDAAVGARVVSLTIAGTNMIMPIATDLTTCSSTFWTSPRADWTPKTWPPPTAIDADPYTGTVSGTHAVFTGTADSSMGISMGKDFSADASTGWISIAYTINSAKAIKAAPWEVTRVPRGGIAFFPSGASAMTKGPWTTVTTSSGTTWVDDTAKTTTSSDGSKAYGDGTGGWFAYAVEGNLFLKKFTDTPANQQAPSDGEVSVYSGSGFLEFEVQGPYTSIAAAGKLTWSVKWRVVKIPSTVTATVGSASLVEFATQQAAL